MTVSPQQPPTQQYFTDYRRNHARYFLVYMLPAMVSLGLALDLFSIALKPASTDRAMVTATLFMVGVAFIAAIAARFIDPLRLASTVIAITAGWVVWSATYSPDHQGTATFIVFPIIAAAYFRTPRETLALSAFSAFAIVVAFKLTPEWVEVGIVPSASFVAIVSGGLLAFIAAQSFKAEVDLDAFVREQQSVVDAMADVGKMRDRLVATVSHELRTPLTSTIGFVETLRRDDIEIGADERKMLLDHAAQGGERLLALVEELLVLSTVSTSTLHLPAEPVCIQALVASALAGIDIGDERQVDVVTSRDAGAIVDVHRVTQVIGNLVVNARNHGAGAIAVTSSVEGGNVVIEVSDEGDGIPEAHLDELFLPFARFSDRADSTGLGLAICRAIVEAHAGELAYSRSDGRTRFTVRIPTAGPR